MSKYKIVESIQPEEVNDLQKYVFVARNHIGMHNMVPQLRDKVLTHILDGNSKKSTIYIDMKSDVLRDILREVLRDVKALSMMETEPSVT
jgi:hypothetical protein